jgi:ribosomal protein S18 acetylase RimI-like enzyme
MIAEITAHYESDKNDLDFAQKGKRAYFSALRVLPEYQGRDLAQALRRHALDELRDSGYSEATIGVEENKDAAKHIYRKLGFSTLVKRCTETFQTDTYDFNLYLNADI